MEYQLEDDVLTIKKSVPSLMGGRSIDFLKKIDLVHRLHTPFVEECMYLQGDASLMVPMTDLESSWYAKHLNREDIDAGEPIVLPQTHSKAWFAHAFGDLQTTAPRDVIELAKFFTLQRELDSLDAPSKIVRHVLDHYPDLELAGQAIDRDFPSSHSATPYVKARIALPGELPKTLDVEALLPIHQRFSVLEEAYKEAWSEFNRDDDTPSNQKIDLMSSKFEDISKKIMEDIPELSRITKNSLDSLMAFRSRDPFNPSWFSEKPGRAIRWLIEYGSFNEHYCHHLDAIETPHQITQKPLTYQSMGLRR